MSEASKPEIGSVGWFDLTVPDAEKVRAFYEEVVGWKAKPHPMGDYADYEMLTPEGRCVAGVCHQQGVNAEVPSHWMLYITVADVEESVRRCTELGGEVIGAIRDLGPHGRLCYVRDPSGAAVALLQPPVDA